jgi:hypothetical protein
MEFLVFNSGDFPMDISLGSEGNIGEIISLEPSTQKVEPEPKPHKRPIKNGKTVRIRFSPPGSGETMTYSGKLVASASPLAGSMFGGTIAVAAPIDVKVTPARSILAMIPPFVWLVLAAVLLVGSAVWWKRKALARAFSAFNEKE